MRQYGMALIGLGVMASLGFAGQASASAVLCSTHALATYDGSPNLPGTYVGTVGFVAGDVCQIGDIGLYNGGTGGALVNSANNPSDYEFYWGGGALEIQEEIGNNGTALSGIDVELDSLASQSSTAISATLASIFIPYTSGKSGEYLLYNEDLGAGYYTLSTYLAGNGIGDPNYQANFSVGTADPVPEPSALALMATALIGFAGFARRRTKG
jgi:hypothetical protein